MSQQISRRALARGGAWSVPVATVSVAASAYAVSRPCNPVLDSGGGFSYDWGVADTERTNQTLKAAGSLTVKNLPADAVITTVDYRLIVMNRNDRGGEKWQDRGAYDPGNNKVNKTYFGNTTCSAEFGAITGCEFKSLYDTTVDAGSAALASGNRKKLLYRSLSGTDPICVTRDARIYLESNWVDRTFRDGT